MTPTLTAILLVALFWTLPASAAVLTYRTHDSSIEKAKTSLQRALGTLQRKRNSPRAPSASENGAFSG